MVKDIDVLDEDSIFLLGNVYSFRKIVEKSQIEILREHKLKGALVGARPK